MTSRQIRRAEARRAAKEARRQDRLHQAHDSKPSYDTTTAAGHRRLMNELDRGLEEVERLLNLTPPPPPPHMQIPQPNPITGTGPTGPRSLAGKARSSLNNLKHGLTSSFRVMDFESQSQYDDLVKSLENEHKPEGATEELLVRKMTEHLWLSRRAQMLLDSSLNDGNEREISLYMRYGITNDRAFSRCLNDLLKLRREKRQAAKEFESQKAKAIETQARVRLANARATAIEVDNERKKSRQNVTVVAQAIPSHTLKRETERPAAA